MLIRNVNIVNGDAETKARRTKGLNKQKLWNFYFSFFFEA